MLAPATTPAGLGHGRASSSKVCARPVQAETEAGATRRTIAKTGPWAALVGRHPSSSCLGRLLRNDPAGAPAYDDRRGRLRGRRLVDPQRQLDLDLLRRRSRSSRSPTGISACAATSTRRAAGPSGTTSRLPRIAAAPVRRGGLRRPGVRRDDDQLTNGKVLRLLVDEEPFDLRYGKRRSTTSIRSTCAPASCAARPAGARPPARASSSARRAWSPLSGGRGDRYEVDPTGAPRGSSCRPSSSPTSRARKRRRTRAPPLRCVAAEAPNPRPPQPARWARAQSRAPRSCASPPGSTCGRGPAGHRHGHRSRTTSRASRSPRTCRRASRCGP